MPRSRPYPRDGAGPEPGQASAGTGASLNGQASAAGSPLGLHRVLEPAGVLPQAAWRLEAKAAIWPDEVRVAVTRLNLDAASFRQLREAHDGNPDKIRASVLDIIRTRGKMQNPVTGSGGMLTGTVDEVGPESSLGLAAGDKIATLVSLSLTPLVITDGLAGWDGKSEQVPCEGHAILFGRSIAAKLPDDLPAELALSVMDVCGAPALTHRVVAGCQARSSQAPGPVVAIIGAAGKSGSLSAAAARQAGAAQIIGVVPHEAEAQLLRDAGAAADGAARPGRRGRHSGRPQPGRGIPRHRERRRPGRCHCRLRGRAGLRRRRDPGHGPGRHGDLLLDGHLVHGRGAGRRGSGRRRHNAGGQRVCPRACAAGLDLIRAAAGRPGHLPAPHRRAQFR